MSSVLSGSSMILNNVYIKSIGTTCGIDEFNGPLGDYFDRHYPVFILDMILMNKQKLQCYKMPLQLL
ncbi:MAG: hypothetical protein ACLTAI_11720 [Thomasclavelia sp.]